MSDIGYMSLEHIVPENQFKADEIQGWDTEGIDKVKEPVKDGNQSLGEQDQIGTGYCCDGATGSEDGGAAGEGMANCAKDGPCEVER